VNQPVFLNSQNIEARYGSYEIDLVEPGPLIRRAVMSSVDKGVRTCRTFALTEFIGRGEPEGSAARERILSGASIGATLLSEGWKLSKQTIHLGSVAVNEPTHRLLALMRLQAPQTLALHVYQMHIGRAHPDVEYATIGELHHPDYFTLDALRKTFSAPEKRQRDAERIERLLVE